MVDKAKCKIRYNRNSEEIQMKFRPCIDIHNGKVKQIVGGSLADKGNSAQENYVSDKRGAYYANLYKEKGLSGGHIILLNKADSEYYEADVAVAKDALLAYPNGLMIGGGINADNAKAFIDAGASHVIVTSYVFKDGIINYDNPKKIVSAVGKDHLVLDLSCRRKNDNYYIVTDRWQNFTDEIVTPELIATLSSYCDEFLIHAVDVEGKAHGIETELVKILAAANSAKITYAGGVGSYDDLRALKELGHAQIDVTIGSALDLFGGSLNFDTVLEMCK
jgi:phosphoribosylformimino-5-aminoimidazole carboxamide ribotide isomerase